MNEHEERVRGTRVRAREEIARKSSSLDEGKFRLRICLLFRQLLHCDGAVVGLEVHVGEAGETREQRERGGENALVNALLYSRKAFETVAMMLYKQTSEDYQLMQTSCKLCMQSL
jgi:hypothetical protein